jgi:Zn-dependent protease with chaperone function
VAAPVPPELVAGRSNDAAEDAVTVAVNDRRALWLVSSRAAVAGGLAGAVAGVAAGLVTGAGAGLAAGLAVAVVVGVVCGAFLRWAGGGLVVRSLGARAPGSDELPRLRNLVEGLCATMGVEPPQVLVVDHPGANALALAGPGRSSYLVVTAGLEPSLSVVELEAVLAHELVRVKLHDTGVAAAALSVTAPLAATGGRGAERVRALLGPSRAFRADQRAAAVVRYPPGLAAALERMVSVAVASRPLPTPWERGRIARCTRPLWVDPVGGDDTVEQLGNLDHTAVRAAALTIE